MKGEGWYSPRPMADDEVLREYRTGSDARTLRDALGCFATGVTVVTCFDQDEQPFGITANSFTSVSLDPPLLLVCIHKHAACAAALAEAKHFAINVLQTAQQPASIRFSTRAEDRFGVNDFRRDRRWWYDRLGLDRWRGGWRRRCRRFGLDGLWCGFGLRFGFGG